MKTTVVIAPIGGYKDTVINGIYHDTERSVFIILQDNWTIQEYKMQSHNDVKGIPYYKILKFDKVVDKYVIKYENEKDKQSPIDKLKEQAIKFWCNHPQTTVNGKVHAKTINAMFNVDITSSKILQAAINLKKKGVVFNRINNMTLAEKRNVSYFFGQAPTGKTDLEMLVFLADFNTGLCMQPEKINDFLKTFDTNVAPQDEVRIIMQKATRLGVITNQSKDGRDNYYLGSTLIGTNFEDLIAYAIKEEVIYAENIRREVAKLDKYVEEEEATDYENQHIENDFILKKNGKVKETKADFDAAAPKQTGLEEFAELKVRAKRLRIQGYHVMGFDNLKRKVLAAEAAKETAPVA